MLVFRRKAPGLYIHNHTVVLMGFGLAALAVGAAVLIGWLRARDNPMLLVLGIVFFLGGLVHLFLRYEFRLDGDGDLFRKVTGLRFLPYVKQLPLSEYAEGIELRTEEERTHALYLRAREGSGKVMLGSYTRLDAALEQWRAMAEDLGLSRLLETPEGLRRWAPGEERAPLRRRTSPVVEPLPAFPEGAGIRVAQDDECLSVLLPRRGGHAVAVAIGLVWGALSGGFLGLVILHPPRTEFAGTLIFSLLMFSISPAIIFFGVRWGLARPEILLERDSLSVGTRVFGRLRGLRRFPLDAIVDVFCPLRPSSSFTFNITVQEGPLRESVTAPVVIDAGESGVAFGEHVPLAAKQWLVAVLRRAAGSGKAPSRRDIAGV